MLMANPKALTRLDSVQRSWLNTPYMEGQSVKGAGVDCIRLVTSILDELYGLDGTKDLPITARDIGHHSGAWRTLAKFALETYPLESEWHGTIQPGDVILTRGESNAKPDSVSHIAMAGRSGAVIHATPPRVSMTAIAGLPPIERVYRPLNVERWSA